VHNDELLLRTLTNESSAFEHDINLTPRRAIDETFRPRVFSIQELNGCVASRGYVMTSELPNRFFSLFKGGAIALRDVRDANLERQLARTNLVLRHPTRSKNGELV
jgi:hypothetical protein